MTMFHNTTEYKAPSDLSKLQHDLERAFDTHELVDVLFNALSKRLDITGLRYDNPGLHIHIACGESARHSCEYNLVQDQRHYGTITTLQKHRLSEVALTRLETILGMFMMPLQDSLLYQQAMTHSHWDPVTRVNNKTAFKRALNTLRAQRRSSDKKLNAVFMHLSNLRTIYAEHGSDASDAMLCHLIDQLRDNCRAGDQIFRFSDDEFVVLLGETNNDQAAIIAHRLSQVCRHHQEHFHGVDLQCNINVEIVECGDGTPCGICEQSEQQRGLSQSQASALHGAA
ncbi:MAG TPA: GGDEF domain-containing protein [Pseudomonadales bacterium]|nr:GGDEF domain-containing protein [Pseudomonadales bacterium]